MMQDLVFSNILMDNVVAPITARLGGWQTDPAMTWSVQGDANREQGVLRNVPKLLGMQRSCLNLCGTVRTTIENVAFNGVHVTFPGGGSAEEGRRRDVPELEHA
jgi:hypothetical protein